MKHIRHIVRTVKSKTSRRLDGFLVVPLLAIGVAITILATLQLVAIGQHDRMMNNQDNIRMANDAADSGLVFARSCLKQSSFVPLWTNTTPLHAGTDCDGDKRYECDVTDPPTGCYLVKTNSVTTDFTVTYVTSNHGATIDITSEGRMDRYAGGEIIDTQKAYKKQHFENSVDDPSINY